MITAGGVGGPSPSLVDPVAYGASVGVVEQSVDRHRPEPRTQWQRLGFVVAQPTRRSGPVPAVAVPGVERISGGGRRSYRVDRVDQVRIVVGFAVQVFTEE